MDGSLDGQIREAKIHAQAQGTEFRNPRISEPENDFGQRGISPFPDRRNLERIGPALPAS